LLVRTFTGFACLAIGLLPPSGASAQTLSPPQDADMPIALVSAVTEVCFQMAYQNALSPAMHSILDPLPQKPAELNGMYPAVPTWYGMKKEPRHLFIGVGDKPNLCHVVMANSKDGRRSFGALSTLLRSTGFTGGWASDGSALLIMTRKWGSSNLIVLLKGLTDATDGVGPQVSVDVGSASDEKLKQLLSGK
jgi:hypothetical protein